MLFRSFPDETQRAAVAYRTYRDEDLEVDELELGGVSILEVGEAKGHDLFVDKKSLQSALKIMESAKNGVKVKMNHGTGLDAVVGFARNPRIEGEKLAADLRLLRPRHFDRSQLFQIKSVLPIYLIHLLQ